MSEQFTFSKSNWDLLKDKKVYETPIFNLHKKEFKPPNHVAQHPYYVIEAPAWVNVIAFTGNNPVQTVLVEQYRHGILKPTLEIPGGVVDDNEDPLIAAKRELSEETGYKSNEWISLGTVSSNPAMLSNYTHLYLAKNCYLASDQHTDASEDIAVHLLPEQTFLDFATKGIIEHSIVMAAVARYLLMEKNNDK